MRVEKSYRGISERLARHYLTNLGGKVVDESNENADGGEAPDGNVEDGDADVVADDWRATITSEKVAIGPSVKLTEVTVVFEGDEETLDALVEDFSQKALRAGG